MLCVQGFGCCAAEVQMARGQATAGQKRTPPGGDFAAIKKHGKAGVSSVRQQQLLADRRLTKAISIFAKDRREELQAQLDPAPITDRYSKRHELLRLARQLYKTLADTDRNRYLEAACQRPAPSTSTPTLPISVAASSSPIGDAQPEDVDSAQPEDGARGDGGQLKDVDGVGEFGCSGSVDHGRKSAEEEDDLTDALAHMLDIAPVSSSRQASHVDEEPPSLADPLPVARSRVREKRSDMAYPVPVVLSPPLPSSGCSGEATPPPPLPPPDCSQSLPLQPSDCLDEAMPPPPTPPRAPPPDTPPRPRRTSGSSGKTALVPNSKRMRESSGVQSSGVQGAGAESAQNSGAETSGVESAEGSENAQDSEEPSLRARLMKISTQQHLRRQLGDAGCMEVLAVSYRILDAAEEGLMHMPGAVGVKLAALVGIAAKYVGSPAYTDKSVEKLWVKIAAGRVSWQDIRKMAKILNMWAEPFL